MVTKKPAVKRVPKRPVFKKLCSRCGKYSFIKSAWSLCTPCWEKATGRKARKIE